MAFILITDSIENTIITLKSDLELNELVFNQTSKEEFKVKADIYRDKLRAATHYKKIVDSRSQYDKIKYLKYRNKDLYIQHCIEIVRDIKGVTFCKRSLAFRVRFSRNKKKLDLGLFDSPSDALEILKSYIN